MLFYEIIDKFEADAPALIFHDQVTTYGQLRQKITVWAAYLQEQGLQKGERVGLFSRNCSDFVVAYYAVIKAGGVIVPFNYQLAMPEAAFIIKDAGIRFLITQEPLPLAAALVENGYEGQLRQVVYEDLNGGRAEAYRAPELEEKDNCTIIYTSGTTGKPKGAMLSHANLIHNTYDFTRVVHMYPTDVGFCVLPMYHCFAWTVAVTGPLFHGACVVILEVYTLAAAVELIQKYKISQFFGVPTMFKMFLDGAEPGQMETLRFFISGGAPIPATLCKDFQAKFGKPVEEGYGLSEASPVVTVNPAAKVKTGSIGPCLPNVLTSIRSEKGEELAAGVVGELCVQGDNVMLGYLNRPQETAHAMRGGRLHTGDLAYKDEEGYIFIVDRIKDMIIAAGENVYPREIEELLYQHPAVKETAVIGVPDKLRGQAVAAYVVLKEGQEATKAQLRRFLMGKLANYKLPKYFVFLDQLPKNKTGKILKKALRERSIEDVVSRLGRKFPE